MLHSNGLGRGWESARVEECKGVRVQESAKVKRRHADTRSLSSVAAKQPTSSVAAERPTGRREDMGDSRKLRWKRKSPGETGAEY